MRCLLVGFVLSLFLVQCSPKRYHQNENPVSELASAIDVVNKFHAFYNTENWNDLTGLYFCESLNKNRLAGIKSQLSNNKYEVGPVLKSRLKRFFRKQGTRKSLVKTYKIVLDNNYLRCHAIETFHLVKGRNGRFYVTDFRVEFI
jgi:hypothetical protein